MFARDFESEYGVDISVASALRICTTPRLRVDPLRDAGHYVGACRRMMARRGQEIERNDGRLLAVGYDHQSPRAWLADGGGYARFLAYYNRAACRPQAPGSPYNCEPLDIAACWRLGIPARDVRRFGWLMHVAGEVAPRKLGLFRLASAIAGAGLSKHPTNVGRGLARRKRAFARMVRALSRVSLRQRAVDGGRVVQWSPKVLQYFGRMSPELQEVAVVCTLRVLPLDVNIVMPRHMPWSAIADAHRAMVARPIVRIAWMAGKRLAKAADDIVLAPAYPHVPLAIAARICRGESPAQVSGGQLSRREAHEWLRAGGAGTPTEWLCRQLPGNSVLRDIAVARWATAVHGRGQWEQLTRIRKIAGPHGQRLEVRFVDKLDEIMVEDLADGPATTVAAAFEAAAQRAGEAYQNRLLGDCRVLCRVPPRWRPYRCIRILRTPAQLAAEGRDMEHCVGTYVSAVESGKSYILALSVCGHRSTAEITADGRVLQHRSRQNREPNTLCKRALARFLEFRT